MQRELGGACCRLMREWMLQHADTTLWPAVKVRNVPDPGSRWDGGRMPNLQRVEAGVNGRVHWLCPVSAQADRSSVYKHGFPSEVLLRRASSWHCTNCLHRNGVLTAPRCMQDLTQKASASPRGVACARWLSAPLLELLVQLCTKAGGDTWCAAGEDAAPWSGPPGTQPLPRVSVWHLISAFAQATDAQPAPAPGSASWMPPASLSPSMTQELLRRGIMSASERAPGTGTGPTRQANTSSLLHKVRLLGLALLPTCFVMWCRTHTATCTVRACAHLE